MTAFDIVCKGCRYRQLSYCGKADEYGFESVGYYCNKEEFGIEKFPRRAVWREYFKREKELHHGAR